MSPQVRFVPTARPLSTRGLPALALALLASLTLFLVTGAERARAYVTPEQAQAAAEAGAGWFESEQAETGALPGDWGMTALAAAGASAADVRTSLLDPSAQDFYVGDWDAYGAGEAATDPERAVLAGAAGGIQTSRISSARNMVAQIASFWDGEQLGAPGLLNDDIFGVLALDRIDAPPVMLEQLSDGIRAKQLPDGGWSWSNSASATSDTDMTGSVVAALCSAGADPATDAGLQRALGFLHSVQDEETGGFAAPPWTPVNTDSTGWAASGLIACGIDPQSEDWTTDSGKTPFDFLLSMQMPDGRFCWNETETCMGSAAYATWDAVRPLAGVAFSAPAAPREDPSDPVVRPAPQVAPGTEVPVTFVVDYGNGLADMCRVPLPSDADLPAALAAAQEGSEPEGCVTGASVTGGTGGDRIVELNGVKAEKGSWVVSVDGGPEAVESAAPIGFGDLVVIRLDGEARVPVEDTPVDPKPGPTPGPGPAPSASPAPAKVRFGSARRFVVRGGSVRPRVVCPAGQGSEGCRGTVTVRFGFKGRARTGGQAPFAIPSGRSARVRVELGRGLRKIVAKRGKRRVSLVAAARSAEGAVALTRAKRVLLPR